MKIEPTDPCPCGAGATYGACCAPVIAGGKPAPTAEALMRSRYTAYVVCDVDHLEASLSPSRRYDFDEESVRQWSQEAVWKGLEILSTREGGPEDDRGEVEFVARFEDQGEEHEFRERALFRRENGAWFYHDGKVKAGETYRREAPKVGRNEPCPCGSGKKFKKCCA